MAQLFTPRATAVFRISLVLALLALLGLGGALYVWARSDSRWNVGQPAPQPIPFRHDLHSGTLEIDCRYCHSTVERAADAGMPTAQTCLTCHSQVWAGASVLEPLRTAVALDQPIRWTSVHRLPAYAYFHHGAHVSSGVACTACHGEVDQMEKTVRVKTLSMGWCLDCHRNPAEHLAGRPNLLSASFDPHARETPQDLRELYREAAPRLTSCNTCHR